MDGGGRSRVGYKYSYQLWIGDDVSTPPYFELTPDIKNYLLEIRTDFVLKTLGGEEEEILDSEVWYGRTSENDDDDGSTVYIYTAYRLRDYWRTEAEMKRFARDVIGFAKQTAAPLVDPTKSFVPIVVDIRVCTTQLKGETVEETRERAIWSKHLVPIFLQPCTLERWTKCSHLMVFLSRIPRVRVGNIHEGLVMMRSCSLCSMKPWIGTQISRLPCSHAFHSRIVFFGGWPLEYRGTCPSCNFQVHDRLPL